jgi:hypothetical protein
VASVRGLPSLRGPSVGVASGLRSGMTATDYRAESQTLCEAYGEQRLVLDTLIPRLMSIVLVSLGFAVRTALFRLFFAISCFM